MTYSVPHSFVAGTKAKASEVNENFSAVVNGLNDTDINKADVDLGNLNYLGNDKLHALKGYSDNGELLTDVEGLADVIGYAHSTFDLSKFTIGGNPIITNDGIASGFTTSNYLTFPYNTFRPGNKPWKVIVKVKTPSTITAGGHVICAINPSANNAPDYGICIQIPIDQTKINFQAFDDNHTLIFSNSVDGLSANTEYLIGIEFTGTQYRGYINGEVVTTFNSTTPIAQSIAKDNYIGLRIGSGAERPWDGSIDLKQFSITVDGVEVFSGNKTGIDTIKPDNYTVVGTPTISADGIASGFSTGNYVKTATFDTTGNFRIRINKVQKTTNRSNFFAILYGSVSNSNSWIAFYLENSTGKVVSVGNGNIVYPVGIPTSEYFDFEIVGDGTNFVYNIYENEALTITTTTLQSRYTSYTSGNGYVDIGGFPNGYYDSSIDLNAFKIYVDGNLVYQPCLKIPYTESAEKYGSKIVNAAYRDRVQDAWQQNYSQRYYTLQEDKVPNYSVVGSPTISSDFVASGFSNSNYLKISNLSFGSSTWEIAGRFIFNSSSNNQAIFSGITNASAPLLYVSPTNMQLNIPSTVGVWGWQLLNASHSFTVGNTYFYKVGWDGANYYIKISDDLGSTWSTLQTLVGTAMFGGSGTFELTIGANIAQSNRYFTGSIDLNAFKIIVDNKLAYQAVIPPNFTLPCGDIYGMIAQVAQNEPEEGENYRNIGEIVSSTIPLTDAGLHLLDGSLINGSGIYADFVTYIAGLVSTYPDLFETEANWQTSVTTYGSCGKFVYDSVNNTVRLPKITGIVEGASGVANLGDLTEAGLPNITGFHGLSGYGQVGGAFYGVTDLSESIASGASFTYGVRFDASRSSSIYGNSNTVQPQTIKVLYYIVVATSTKTAIQVDIDEIATDLNGKADTDLSNTTNKIADSFLEKITPDYENGIQTTLTTAGVEYSYTCPSVGVICAICFLGTDNSNGYVKINDVNVAFNSSYGSGTYNVTFSASFVVAKGDVIKAKNTYGQAFLLFCPMKGAS